MFLSFSDHSRSKNPELLKAMSLDPLNSPPDGSYYSSVLAQSLLDLLWHWQTSHPHSAVRRTAAHSKMSKLMVLAHY